MLHRKRIEPPAGLNANGARRDSPQSVPSFALRPDRVGEIKAHKSDRLAAADDLYRAAHPVEIQCREQPRQPQNMIEMGVRQQHVSEPAKAHPGAHQLALGSLAAIDEKAIRPGADEQRRQSTRGGGYGRRGTEKYQFEQLHLPSAALCGHHFIRRRPRRWGDIRTRRL